MGMAEQREKPILFSGPMVRQILAGAKTQTRRIVRLGSSEGHARSRLLKVEDGFVWFGDSIPDDPVPIRVRMRYRPGDRLWVRERMRVIGRGPVTRRADMIRVRYEADGAESGLLPYPERLRGDPVIGKCLSYGGHREASRITLEVTDVRVERLQDISEQDARAEGVGLLGRSIGADQPFIDDSGRTHGTHPYTLAFAVLWDTLNYDRGFGWVENPWVEAYTFRVTQAHR